MKVAASILDCDFPAPWRGTGGGREGRRGRDYLDVMDGHFVPNLSFGVPLAKAVRRAVTVPVHTHLMVNEPEWLIEKFLPYSDLSSSRRGAEMPVQCLETIHSAGKAAGISLNPNNAGGVLRTLIAMCRTCW